MSDTKEIIITENATQKGGKRRSRKMKGGGSTQGAVVQLHSTSSSGDVSTVSGTTGINPPVLTQIAAPLEQKGGKKVILNAGKKKTQKVVLSVSKTPQVKIEASKSKTRKAKKISFSLKNLRNKLHKAKTIKQHSEEKSFSEIKKTLEEAKLIKKDSKAPETMIRHIYSDFMTLKHKAL